MGESFATTSPADARYNCAAWAAGDVSRQWWPEPDQPEYFWPAGALRDGTIAAFIDGYEHVGFERCGDATAEPGFEKVALFATRLGSPQHVARQLPGGAWTSKIGNEEDISHEALGDVAGGRYGQPVAFLRRPQRFT